MSIAVLAQKHFRLKEDKIQHLNEDKESREVSGVQTFFPRTLYWHTTSNVGS